MLTAYLDAEQRENPDPSDRKAKDHNTGRPAENAVPASVVLMGKLRMIFCLLSSSYSKYEAPISVEQGTQRLSLLISVT